MQFLYQNWPYFLHLYLKCGKSLENWLHNQLSTAVSQMIFIATYLYIVKLGLIYLSIFIYIYIYRESTLFFFLIALFSFSKKSYFMSSQTFFPQLILLFVDQYLVFFLCIYFQKWELLLFITRRKFIFVGKYKDNFLYVLFKIENLLRTNPSSVAFFSHEKSV